VWAVVRLLLLLLLLLLQLLLLLPRLPVLLLPLSPLMPLLRPCSCPRSCSYSCSCPSTHYGSGATRECAHLTMCVSNLVLVVNILPHSHQWAVVMRMMTLLLVLSLFAAAAKKTHFRGFITLRANSSLCVRHRSSSADHLRTFLSTEVHTWLAFFGAHNASVRPCRRCCNRPIARGVAPSQAIRRRARPSAAAMMLWC